MRLQPKPMAAAAGVSGHDRRPVRLVIGTDHVFDMSRTEALTLADQLVDAAELSQETT